MGNTDQKELGLTGPLGPSGFPIESVVRTACVFGFIFLTWYTAAALAYRFIYQHVIFPSAQTNSSFFAYEKLLEYLLLSSSWLILWPTLRLEPWVRSQAREYRPFFRLILLGVLLAMAVLFKGRVFGAVALIGISSFVYSGPARGLRNDLQDQLVSVVIFILLCAALATVIYQRQLTLSLDLFEDGPRLASASAFLAGKLPFRDFVVHYGILQEVVKPFLAFHIWGVTYEAYLRAGAWLSVASGLGILLLMGQVLRHRWWLWIAALVLVCRSDLYLPDRLFFAIFAVLAYNQALATRRVVWGVAAGFGIVLCLLYSLDIGVTLIAGFSAYGILGWLADRQESAAPEPWSRRSIVYGVLGASAAAAVFTAGAALAGALKPFVTDNLALLTHYSGNWSDQIPSHLFAYGFLAHRQPLFLYVAIQQIPFLGLAVAAYLLGSGQKARRTARWHQMLLLACVVFFEFFIYIGRSDFSHWLNATPFVWPLAAAALEEITGIVPLSLNLRRRFFSAVLLGALVATPFWSALCGNLPLWISVVNRWASFETGPKTAPGPEASAVRRLGKISRPPAKVSEAVEVVGLIQAHVRPTETFFDLSNHGGFYFLSERQNATSFGLVNEVQGPRMLARCLDELRRHPPQAILAKASGGVVECPENALPVRDYLLSRYHVGFRASTGGWVLLIPNTIEAGR